MYTYLKYPILAYSFFAVLGCSKVDDFLDKKPLDAVSAESFFRTSSDLKIYANKFYDRLAYHDYTTGDGQNNLRLDLGSDFMIDGAILPGNLNQISNAGVAGTKSDAWNGGYTNIRQYNYMLHYASLQAEKTPQANHYIGEALFFRAWQYYDLLVAFGDVPILTEILTNNDTEKLYRQRNSRYEVAKQAIADLDQAIDYLFWKGEGEAASGRVNKESALVMKQRIALFEGTWERYHGQKGSPFAVSGKDGTEFFNMVVEAGDMLIARQGKKIFTTGAEPYNQLTAQNDGAAVDGVFLYRAYVSSLLVRSHHFYGKVEDQGPSITNHLVDLYLQKDGTPQAVEEGYTAPYTATLDALGKNLDPRFRQTIWTPDRGPANQIAGRNLSSSFRYPVIAQTSIYVTSTGYRNWKGAILDASQFRAGNTDDIFIRYGEGLLAYAEAKAILGSITQADLDNTVNVLRDRVKMSPMTLAQVNSFSNYDERLGFSTTESNIVNEIRRERSVELALEGFRLTDLKRWAVFDKVINGYKPQGAYLQEFIDYFNNDAAMKADGVKDEVISGLGTGRPTDVGSSPNVGRFANGRTNPFFKSNQFGPAGQGLYINPNRDYLSSIPRDQIQLYSAKANVELTQNPGWN